MTTKQLHLCVCMSDSYFPIYQEIFNPTLPAEFDSVYILHIRDCDAEPGHVGEKNFKNINYKRLHFITKQMKMHEGDNLLVMDLDVVCFRDFKEEINTLLEHNDMVFQHNPHYETMPYCVATWAMQCTEKNMHFFEEEILPRTEALLVTKDLWDHIREKEILINRKFVHYLNGKQEYFHGDACLVNAAIQESDLGAQLNVALLPPTYTQGDGTVPPNGLDYALYQSAATGHGIDAKRGALRHIYQEMKKR